MAYIVADPLCKIHISGFGHPEKPERYDAIFKTLSTLPLKILKSRSATKDEILLCHTQMYFDLVKKEVKEKRPSLSTGDTILSKGSLEAALLAAGGVLTAIDAVMKGIAKNVFCVVRPPGHHACSNGGMGFCIFNNIAIGARYVQKRYGIKKVLIVDWDVHHGNGTQEIFDDDPSVYYFSTHQLGLYPGTGNPEDTGRGKAKGTKLNCPIFPGSNSREEVIKAFKTKLVPAMVSFKPDFVMISAGFDAHQLDPLGGFNLTEEDYSKLTIIVKAIADKYCKGRIVSVLEGGYNLKATAQSALAHVKSLISR